MVLITFVHLLSTVSDYDERRPSVVVDLCDEGISGISDDFESSSYRDDSSEIDSRKGSNDFSEKLALNACTYLSKVKHNLSKNLYISTSEASRGVY